MPSTSIPLTPEQRAARWGTAAKIATIGVLGFLVSPFVLSAIGGLLGLLALATIYGVTYVTLPAIGDWGKNMRLSLIKSEAARDPIGTLESEHLRRTLLLDERKTAIETFAAKTGTFGGKLEGFKRQYPEEAPKFQHTYDQMQLLLRRQREQWSEANRGLALFAGEVKKAKAMWDMALAAAAAREGSGLDETAFLAQLKVDTSLDTISEGMSRAFAQLDTLIMEGDANAQINVTPAKVALPAPDGRTTIEASILNAPIKARVS